MTTPAFWGAKEAAQQIRSRAITSADYLDTLLVRIKRLEPTVQAWARIAEDDARAEAARCDAEAVKGRWRGPLHGVPVAL